MELTDPLFLLLLFHGAACLAVGAAPRLSMSRRVLGTAFVLTVPVAGPILAAVSSLARNRGSFEADMDAGLEVEEHRLGARDVRRLSDRIPAVDLLADDGERRREALAELARAGDAAAITALRFSVEHGESDMVLEAAMTLDELVRGLDERRAELRRRVAANPTYENALAAGDAPADAVHAGLADAALHPSLAAEARSFYAFAASRDPDRAPEVRRRLARLELAVRRPNQALAALEGDEHEEARELRAEAALAARRFDLLPPRHRAA